jgi:hypothetical protein
MSLKSSKSLPMLNLLTSGFQKKKTSSGLQRKVCRLNYRLIGKKLKHKLDKLHTRTLELVRQSSNIHVTIITGNWSSSNAKKPDPKFPSNPIKMHLSNPLVWSVLPPKHSLSL